MTACSTPACAGLAVVRPCRVGRGRPHSGHRPRAARPRAGLAGARGRRLARRRPAGPRPPAARPSRHGAARRLAGVFATGRRARQARPHGRPRGRSRAGDRAGRRDPVPRSAWPPSGAGPGDGPRPSRSTTEPSRWGRSRTRSGPRPPLRTWRSTMRRAIAGSARTCGTVIPRRSPSPSSAPTLASVLTLGPGGFGDDGKGLAWIENLPAAAPPTRKDIKRAFQQVSGALLFRAGRPDEAIGRIHEAIGTGGGPPEFDENVFVAMASFWAGDRAGPVPARPPGGRGPRRAGVRDVVERPGAPPAPPRGRPADPRRQLPGRSLRPVRPFRLSTLVNLSRVAPGDSAVALSTTTAFTGIVCAAEPSGDTPPRHIPRSESVPEARAGDVSPLSSERRPSKTGG